VIGVAVRAGARIPHPGGSGPPPTGTVVYFATQGPKADFDDTTPPPLSGPMQTEVSDFAAQNIEIGRNEFDDAGGAATTIAFNYTGGSVSVSEGSPVVRGGPLANLSLGRYNMTANLPSDGTYDPGVGHWMQSAAAAPFPITLEFSTNVQAFLIYIVDLGDFLGDLAVELYDGATLVFSQTVDNDLSGNGNLSVFGVSSYDFSFNKLRFNITQADPMDPDILGFDTLIIGTPNFA
jgi:hypothetical protein